MTCTGTTAGDALLGGIVTVDIPIVGGGFAVVTGTIVGPTVGVTAPVQPAAAIPSALSANLPRLIPPPVPQFIPPPPPPLLPPPPPAPMGLQPAGALGPPEVPVIPEADSMFLVVAGLVALGGLVGLRRMRRRDDKG